MINIILVKEANESSEGMTEPDDDSCDLDAESVGSVFDIGKQD